MDSTATEKKAREFLQIAVRGVFPLSPGDSFRVPAEVAAAARNSNRRGTLAMFAQWISLAQTAAYRKAAEPPLLTLGSAPLECFGFRSVVLGQLGESRLAAAIETDIGGDHSTPGRWTPIRKGVLRDIHRRVGNAILFESTGGQISKVAHLPELRFALGEPDLDTTTVDTAAMKLESNSFFIQKVGADAFKVFYKAKIDKAVHDRKASLDEDSEIKPTLRTIITEEFDRGASIPIEPFPADSSSVADFPRLHLVLMNPDHEWDGQAAMRDQIADWTKNRGKQSRLYPRAGSCGACASRAVICASKVNCCWPGGRVQKDVREGIFGRKFEKADLQEIAVKVKETEGDARDEVSGQLPLCRAGRQRRSQRPEGHRPGGRTFERVETMCGRIVGALKAEALLNETVGIGYIDRNWPPAFKTTGVWPLGSLRQSFLNGALTRLLDPDAVLRAKIVEFVAHRDCGLASGPKPDGTYEHVWYDQLIPPDEVTFDSGVFLLTKAKAKSLKSPPAQSPKPEKKKPEPEQAEKTEGETEEPAEKKQSDQEAKPTTRTLRLSGTIPSEVWNRLGTKLISKLVRQPPRRSQFLRDFQELRQPRASRRRFDKCCRT